MLKKITVGNYKCFDELTFDLAAAEYSYNPMLVKDGVVNKALIYGKNGTGKTSLGFAIFDLVQHLTDKHCFPYRFMEYYRNLNTGRKAVSFQYTFAFDYKEIVYEYEKTDAQNLVYERLEADGKTLLDYHYGVLEKQFVAKELCGNLDIRLPDNKLSILKYIYRNTPTDFSPVLTRLMRFCENMLWFRSLSDGQHWSRCSMKADSYRNFRNFWRKMDFSTNWDLKRMAASPSFTLISTIGKARRFLQLLPRLVQRCFGYCSTGWSRGRTGFPCCSLTNLTHSSITKSPRPWSLN